MRVSQKKTFWLLAISLRVGAERTQPEDHKGLFQQVQVTIDGRPGYLELPRSSFTETS